MIEQQLADHSRVYAPAAGPRRRWIFLTKRERWGLSWPGWMALFLALIFCLSLFLVNVQPFLASTHRVDANMLVVEGWVHDFVINQATSEFRTGGYERVFATGGPSNGSGGYTWDADTSASVGAGQLRAAGMPPAAVQMVPSRVIGRDRTYSSAIALRDWFREHDLQVKSFNIVAESTHARRTWLLFQEAFGDEVKVGVIAVQNPDYDPKHWWRSSDGFREVLSECVAYFYARFVFSPPKDESVYAAAK